MKKITAIILAAILILTSAIVFAGCSSTSKTLTIAIPNDTTNEARALLLLDQLGYIKLKDGAGITATPKDIAENPKNIEPELFMHILNCICKWLCMIRQLQSCQPV